VRRLRGRRRWALALIGLAVGFALCAVSVTLALAAEDAVIAVDGQRLHVQIFGEAGPTTVVFEAGLGNDASTWRKVAPAVSRFARVVLYDRAGLGRSLPLSRRDAPITAAGVAASLRDLLRRAGLTPPFVLVGHSAGGLYVQLFARQYPRDVAGVVLIDAASADAPPELKTRARLEPGSAAYLEEAGMAASSEEVSRAGPFPDVPLVVVAATDHGPFFRKWEPLLMRLQRQLAELSPMGRLVVAEGSGHDVQTERPALVVAAIRTVIDKPGR
jgi:pimeloyl-ACP methyl ester carboxylesterase